MSEAASEHPAVALCQGSRNRQHAECIAVMGSSAGGMLKGTAEAHVTKGDVLGWLHWITSETVSPSKIRTSKDHFNHCELHFKS